MDINLHSLPRQLIELRIEHAELDSQIDQSAATRLEDDDLTLRRLKKRRLALRDQIIRLGAAIDPPVPA